MGQSLTVRGLSAFYGPVQALFDVNLDVAAGQITVLQGDNGAGKTTLLRAICQEIPTQGEVRLAGECLTGRSPESIARLGVLHGPEDRGGFATLSVEDNLRLGALRRRDRRQRALDLQATYARFPWLHTRRHQQAGTLSGGEQQMLALARALLCRPQVLLLDEPLLGLAPQTAAAVLAMLRELNQTHGLTLLLVEHDAAAVMALADAVYVLDRGRVCSSLPTRAKPGPLQP